MTISVLIPSLVSAAAVVAAAWLTYRGSRREAVTSREHRMIDQIQEERDHWQRRAEAAEAALSNILYPPDTDG